MEKCLGGLNFAHLSVLRLNQVLVDHPGQRFANLDLAFKGADLQDC